MAVHQESSLFLTHGYLNIVHAGYQGKYVALSAAGELDPQRADPVALADVEEALNRIIGWYQALWQRQPMVDVAGRQDPSPDAPALLALWDELRDDFRALVADLEAVYAAGRKTVESSRLLAASLCRQAYAREHFIKGLVGWGERFDDEAVADRWRQHLLSCQEEIRVAHKVLGALVKAATPDLMNQLYDECMLLPAILRCRLHDMAVLEAHRAGGLSFARLRVDEREARDWRTIGIGPNRAGYWMAYGLSPIDAQRWINAGFSDFASAGVWRTRGFDIRDAVQWHNAGYEPLQAMQARETGLAPEPAHA